MTESRKPAPKRPPRSAVPDPVTTAGADADGRRRQARGQDARERIISAAIELLATNGYRSTSIADVADAAGMTHPGLLYHFGSKERLLYEVVRERERIERISLTSQQEADSSLAQLPQIARDNLEHALLIRLHLVLAAESFDDDAPLHDFFVRRFDRARSVVAFAARNDIDHGVIVADVDVDQLSREVVATLIGLEMQWLTDPKRVDYIEAVEAYTASLLSRLTPRASERS